MNRPTETEMLEALSLVRDASARHREAAARRERLRREHVEADGARVAALRTLHAARERLDALLAADAAEDDVP